MLHNLNCCAVNIYYTAALTSLSDSVSYDVFKVDHAAVLVEPKVARPIACPLTWKLSVVNEHSQVSVYFILKLLRTSETVTSELLYLNYQKLNFKIYLITDEIRLNLQSAEMDFSCFQEKIKWSFRDSKHVTPQLQSI